MLVIAAAMASTLPTAERALGAGDGCPAGQACVVVEVVGESPATHEFSIADLQRAPDVRTGQTYHYRSAPDVNFDAVLPVRDLLRQLGTPPSAVTFVELSATTSARASELVTADGDLDDPGPFAGGLLPAIYSDGSSFGYTRGQRDAADHNERSTITTTGHLVLTVHTSGRPLHPVVTATPQTQPRSNQAVRLEAQVEEAPGLRYDWRFGDGTTLDGSTDARPTHQYRRS